MHQWAITQQVSQLLYHMMRFKIILLKFLPYLLGISELSQVTATHLKIGHPKISSIMQFSNEFNFITGYCDLEIWQMTLKNNRTTLPCHFKFWASFCSHLWIQTGFTVWKRSIQVKKNFNFSICVNFKFDGWLWKTRGHLFYTTSIFVLHFVTICEIDLELSSENAPTGAKFVLTFVTLTFHLWPWSFAWTSLL